MARAGLFVLTFSAIFILLGMTATGLGQTLTENRSTLEKVAGIAIIAMGVLFVLALFVPMLNREWHVDSHHAARRPRRPAGGGRRVRDRVDPVRGPGARFDPRPRRDDRTRSAQGGGLLAVYSAGLAVPFLLTAVAFNRATTAFAWIKRHYAVINGVAGVLLIAIGMLVLTGELFRLNIEAQKMLDGWGLNFFQDVVSPGT